MQPRNSFASRGADYHVEGDYKAIFLRMLTSVGIHDSFFGRFRLLLIRHRYPTVTAPVQLYG
jgi:hypothetical protein